MLTPNDIRNPRRGSGFDHVRHMGKPRPRPWQAQGGGRRRDREDGGHVWYGPYRATPEEAAQDYCDYINGNKIKTHERGSGRPDFFMDDTGTLHLDLPAATTVTKARSASKSTSPERALIERLQARMLVLMRPGDFAEAKAGVGRQQIVTAVGQLKLRKHETKSKGRMFLVVPKRPKLPHERWIKSEGITLIIEKEAATK